MKFSSLSFICNHGTQTIFKSAHVALKRFQLECMASYKTTPRMLFLRGVVSVVPSGSCVLDDQCCGGLVVVRTSVTGGSSNTLTVCRLK